MPFVHEIPVDQIIPDPDNPRAGELEGIDALAANIDAIGLLNPINVRLYQETDGLPIYMIVAGHRRLRAMAEGLGWKSVPCTVVAPESTTELALTENIMRQNLHPVDEHKAFVALKLAGYTVKKIAKRFGVDTRTVKQRLALGSIIPEFLELWRGDKISWDSIKVLAQMKPGKQKEALVEATKSIDKHGHVEDWVIDKFVSHKRIYLEAEKVRFVGLEEYEKAGGRIDEDLFGDEQWIADVMLLDSLYDNKKLREQEAAQLEGWRSVEWVTSSPSNWSTHQPIGDPQKIAGLTTADKAKIDLKLMVIWDGTVRRTHYEDRPMKPEEYRAATETTAATTGYRATYGKPVEDTDKSWDVEVKVKAAAIAKLHWLMRSTNYTMNQCGRALIRALNDLKVDVADQLADALLDSAKQRQVAALPPPKTGTVPEKDLPVPVRVPVDDDPPETEIPKPSDSWDDIEPETLPAPEEPDDDGEFEDEAELVTASRLEVEAHIRGRFEELKKRFDTLKAGAGLSTEDVVEGVKYQLIKSGVDPAFVIGMNGHALLDPPSPEPEDQWLGDGDTDSQLIGELPIVEGTDYVVDVDRLPPAGEGEVSPGNTETDDDTEQGPADRKIRKRPRGTKAQRGRSRRKLQPGDVGEVA